ALLGQLVDDVAMQYRFQLVSGIVVAAANGRCDGICLIHQPNSLRRCHRVRLRDALTPKSRVSRSKALVSGLPGASLNRSTPRLRLCRRSRVLSGRVASSGMPKLFSSVASLGTTPSI